MTNFDNLGNIILPGVMGNKIVLRCPRDGTYIEPRPDQTIFSTYNTTADDSSRYANLIKNAPHDPTTILVKKEKCCVPDCKSTFFKHLRLGSSEKSVLICMAGHQQI